eukprot:TRINITY_DN35160_c0_g3_i1.p1 TRINITY_DN35160_c0_g3~~TRINITY_DN35160_c0_g3_i1.p1  ORF type:complete len:126 (+),score=29.55 TRINITY_DN35160_c0_g3_i1:137-514(+)
MQRDLTCGAERCWSCCRGIPSKIIARSMATVSQTRMSFPSMRPILKKFERVDEIFLEDLEEQEESQHPSPDKVLREKLRGNKVVLVPIDSAMALVLRHDLRGEAPSVQGLKELIWKKSHEGRKGN